ncbi:hypothetical protein GN156_00025 [bacterium LRH843]|nr:hypothetical protein [bacterium LRH843]
MIEAFITAGAVVVTALFTYWTTVRSERKKQVNKHRLDILQKLYGPIYKAYNSSVIPTDGFEGLWDVHANKIIEIFDENIEIADPLLEEFIWGLKEDVFINNRNRHVVYDEDRKLLEHVSYNYNLLRKQLNLPYDSAYFSFSEVINYNMRKWLRRKKRIRALRIVRKHNAKRFKAG